MTGADLLGVVTVECNLDIVPDLAAETAIKRAQRRTCVVLPKLLESSVELEKEECIPGWWLGAAEDLVKEKVRPAVLGRQTPTSSHPARQLLR